MPRPPAMLPSWLLADLGPTLGLATALTGSRPGALDLVTEAFARDRSWTALAGGPDPTPRLRASVVRTFLASPLGRSTPPGPAAGLDALTGPPAPLSCSGTCERLNDRRDRQVMDRPGKTGRHRPDHVPAGTHDARDRRAGPPWPPRRRPWPTVRRHAPAGSRSQRTRRTGPRPRPARAAAAVASRRSCCLAFRPTSSRPASGVTATRCVHRTAGASATGRSTPTSSRPTSSCPGRTGADDLAGHCVASRGGWAAGPCRLPRPPRRAGGPVSSSSRRSEPVTLAWQYADDAWAWVQCPTPRRPSPDPQRLARPSTSTDRRQLLPFMLDALPEGYRIRTVGEAFSAPGTGWGPSVLLDPPANSYWPILSDRPEPADPTGSRRDRPLPGAGRDALCLRRPDGRSDGVQPGACHAVPGRGARRPPSRPPTRPTGPAWFDASTSAR